MRDGLVLLGSPDRHDHHGHGPGGAPRRRRESPSSQHQLLVLTRSRRKAPPLRAWTHPAGSGCDTLSHQRILKSRLPIRPRTLLRFHRALVRRSIMAVFPKTGRRPDPKAHKGADCRRPRSNASNPRVGCPRIAHTDIARLRPGNRQGRGAPDPLTLIRRCGGQGPSWLSAIAETVTACGASDLFRCESILMRDMSRWYMESLPRRIVDCGVEPAHIDGIRVCRNVQPSPVRSATPSASVPIHDHIVPLHRWRANLRILDIEELSRPFVPRSHPVQSSANRKPFGASISTRPSRTASTGHPQAESISPPYYNQPARSRRTGWSDAFERVAATSAFQPVNLQHFAWRSTVPGSFTRQVARNQDSPFTYKGSVSRSAPELIFMSCAAHAVPIVRYLIAKRALAEFRTVQCGLFAEIHSTI